MLLAVDIGNSYIKLALFKGKIIWRGWRIVTVKGRNAHYYAVKLRRLFRTTKVDTACIDAIFICSVVPHLTAVIKKALLVIFHKRPLILGKDVTVPIRNLYKKPKQVGQDRLTNAVAAISRYGAPAIVVDFGTALTFDLVSEKGSYLGGIIVPGMEVALKALIHNADLLPKISLNEPRVLLGTDTVSSMKSGIVYGYSFMVEGILKQLKKKLRQKPYILATGGAAGLMSRYCKSISRIEANLTLEGIRILYEKEKGIKKLKKQRK